ncbi:MAG: HNH endonuclease [Ramlibacter sp.]
MPQAAPRPCARPGCGRLVPAGAVCPVHPVAPGSFGDRSRGTRQQRGYGRAWEKVRERVLFRDQGLCQPCLAATPERITPAVAVDHIKPKAEGGTDAESNLQAICKACHDQKTAEEARRGRGV